MTAPPDPRIGTRITVVLPVDEVSSDAGPGPLLAPRLDGVGGRTLGVVDNGLWRSMGVLVDGIDHEWRGRGGSGSDRVPFDHLAPDFAEHQRALVPFSKRIAGAVTGLGN